MTNELPKDLKEAENDLYDSIVSYLNKSDLIKSFLSVNLKFEGLRINPIITRLSEKIEKAGHDNILLWADAGGAALAKRDIPNHSNNIFTYKEFLSRTELHGKTILAITPQPYDIEEFERLCFTNQNSIIMFNGKLEDPIVGIGSVGREMRKRFSDKWKSIYYLQPLNGGALLKKYPNDWELYKSESNGYTFINTFPERPDDETILLSL